jgi:hypothetical protein
VANRKLWCGGGDAEDAVRKQRCCGVLEGKGVFS